MEITSHDIISPRQISFTADNVKCITSKCDKDGNAAAVLVFTSAKGEKAMVIMTEPELQATLKGRQYQKMMLSAEKAFEGSENPYDFYPRNPISGTVRPDFVPVFEDALQQVRDAKVLVRLGRNKGEVGLFETAPTNVMQLVAGGQVVTAYATRDFPRGEIGTKRNVGIRHG